MAVFAILMSVNFAACSDDGDGGSSEPSNPLVGIWTTDWNWGVGTRSYFFKSDGTYTWDVGVYDGGKGYYSFNYPQLTLSESGGGTSLWTIVSMEQNYFVIMTKSADTYTFTKSEGVNNVQDVSGTVQGHDYVDLGLSVKWATCNVGATAPEKEGDFFAWGETATKSEYNWDNYKWGTYDYCCGDRIVVTKYCTDENYGKCQRNFYDHYYHYQCEGFTDGLTTLLPADDAAYVKWGSSWRMPTQAEMEELITKCTWTWTMRNGYTGYKVTGRNGKSIFLPTVWTKDNYHSRGWSASYWTASLLEYDSVSSYALDIDDDNYKLTNYWGREYGNLIRPVTK